MQYYGDIDLRLDGFFPGMVLIPPEKLPSVAIGFLLLTISIFSTTWPSLMAGTCLRFALAPLAIYFFWDYGYGLYDGPTRGCSVDVGMASVCLYGIMRILETTFVGLLDEEPPRWVVEEKEVSLPTTISGRFAYAFDLATSVRGNSWFSKTHWEWAPRALVNSPTRFMTRSQFLRSAITSLFSQYVILDLLDTIHKARTWPRADPYPITSLPWYEQLVYSTSVCAQTTMTLTVPYTLISSLFVLLGSHPESWPPMFNAPFTSITLADFWTRRWHAIFRRVFERLSSVILHIPPISYLSPPSLTWRTIRSIIIFALSTLLHILLMYRVDMLETEDPRTFLDPSIIKCFLSQPLGLALEVLVVLPVCSTFVPAGWRDTVSRVWTWTFLLWAGRFWSDVWVHRGFWEEKERMVGWSIARGVLYGKWMI